MQPCLSKFHEPEIQFTFTVCSVSLPMLSRRHKHVIKMFLLRRIRCGKRLLTFFPLTRTYTVNCHFLLSSDSVSVDCGEFLIQLQCLRRVRARILLTFGATLQFSLLFFVVAVETSITYVFYLNFSSMEHLKNIMMKNSVVDEPSSSSFLLSFTSAVVLCHSEEQKLLCSRWGQRGRRRRVNEVIGSRCVPFRMVNIDRNTRCRRFDR